MTLPLNSRLSALYDTNGTQKDFSFGFRVFFDPDNGGYGLEVRRQTADGYEVIPKSDYLVLPVEDNSAGVVRFSVAPSAGQQIYIAGKTPTIQQLVLTNFGRYSAESIETQFDFITAIIQEWLSALGEETRQRIAADNILTQYVVQRIDDFVQQINQNWDDKSQEIEDYISTIMPSFTQTLREEIEAYAVAGMQDAIDQTLAESKAEIDDAVARANAAALAAAITGKVYDTPEAGVDPVTGVAYGAYFNVRSSSDESYIDEYQNVGGVATPTGKSYPSSQVIDRLQQGIKSITQLRLTKPSKEGDRVHLSSVNEGQNEGGGEFVATQEVGLVDNGVTVFASPNPTIFWVRVNFGEVLTPEMAGAKVNDKFFDNTPALNKVIRLKRQIELSEGYYYTDKPVVLIPGTRMRGKGAMSFYNTDSKHLGTAIIKLTNSVDPTLPTAYVVGSGNPTTNLSTMNAVVIAYDPENKQQGYAGSLDITGITFSRFNSTFPTGHTNNDARWYKFDGTRYCPNFQENGNTQGSYIAPNTYTFFASGLSQSSLTQCNFFNSRYNVYCNDAWLVDWTGSQTYGGTGFTIRTGTSNNFNLTWALGVSWNVPTDSTTPSSGKCYGYSIGGAYHQFGVIACDGVGSTLNPAQAVLHSVNPLGFNIDTIGSEGVNAYSYIDVKGWAASATGNGVAAVHINTINAMAVNTNFYDSSIAESKNAVLKVSDFCDLVIGSGIIELTGSNTTRATKLHFASVGWGSSLDLGNVFIKGQQVTGYVLGTTPFPDTRSIEHNEVWVNLDKFSPSVFRWKRGTRNVQVADNYSNNSHSILSGDLRVVGVDADKTLTLAVTNVGSGQTTIRASNKDGRYTDISTRSGQYYGLIGTDGWLSGYDTINATSFTSNHWSCISNNSKSLGLANRLWTTVYAETGTINTSDERYKQQFRSQTERERDAALEIKNSIQLFKFNDAVDLKGDSARWHVGVKAQQVVRILESHGLDPFDYAFLCYDEWDGYDEVLDTWDSEYDSTGNLIREAGSQVLQHAQEAGSRYAIRYDELSMFIFAAI